MLKWLGDVNVGGGWVWYTAFLSHFVNRKPMM